MVLLLVCGGTAVGLVVFFNKKVQPTVDSVVAQDVDAGPLGGKARCGAAESQGVPMAVCAWVDNGSLGMVVWYYKTVNEIKAEFITVRGQIEQKS